MTYFLMLFFVFWLIWDLRFLLALLISKLRYHSMYGQEVRLTKTAWFEITAFAALGTFFFHNMM